MFAHDINEYISQIWDKNIFVRAQDLESGTDITYRDIIAPWTLDKLKKNCNNDGYIIDIGCGCGYLTNLVFENGFSKIKGIDISKNSIIYAKEKYPYINFTQKNILDTKFNMEYDFGLVIMTLNNISDAKLFFHALNGILKLNGKALIIIPHPCFWPIKHIKKDFLSYLLEKSYDISFSTKGRKDYPSNIIYFHRPLEKYFEYIKESGFKITSVNELKEAETENVPDLIGIIIQKIS